MPFDFSLDDILDFDNDDTGMPGQGALDAVVRNYKAESPSNLRTTASNYGYANSQVSVSNIGQLMMGIPLYKDPSISTSQNEYLISSLLGSTLTQGKEDKLGGGFDEMVPGDIGSIAANDRSKAPGGADQSAEDAAADTNNTNPPAKPGAVSSQGWIWPCDGGKVTSPFGYRIHPVSHTRKLHKGIDISIPPGTNIYAAKGGTVTRKDEPNGAGWYIHLTHDDGSYTQYFHLSKYIAADGAKVAQGAQIGLSGGAKNAPGAGNSTGPHLHFEIRDSGGTPVDPVPLLPKQG